MQMKMESTTEKDAQGRVLTRMIVTRGDHSCSILFPNRSPHDVMTAALMCQGKIDQLGVIDSELEKIFESRERWRTTVAAMEAKKRLTPAEKARATRERKKAEQAERTAAIVADRKAKGLPIYELPKKH